MIKNVKNTVPEHMLLMISLVKKLLEHFMEKELQKTNQEKVRMEKVIKIK